MREPRASTFFGRLSGALREQNWLAAGIEVGIVVLGVVMGSAADRPLKRKEG